MVVVPSIAATSAGDASEGSTSGGRRRRERGDVLVAAYVEELALDAAFVTLNLAVMLLEEGRAGEVRELAAETMSIFESLGLGEEAPLSARGLLASGRAGAAPAEMGRCLLASLERAHYDPDLRFDPGA